MVLFQLIFVMDGTHPFSTIRITVTKKCFAMVVFILCYRVRVIIHASSLTTRHAWIAALLRASAMEQVNTVLVPLVVLCKVRLQQLQAVCFKLHFS